MSKRVLLVGCEYTGSSIPDVRIDTLGLCRASVCEEKAAFSLYEYDLIIINPESYSHFIFGSPTKHSSSDKELWDLKAENNKYDLDDAYDRTDRSKELSAAIAQGTRVLWIMAPQKRIKFYGLRSIYIGYANSVAADLIETANLHQKKSRRITIKPEAGEFVPYFEQLQKDGWKLCLSDYGDTLESFAESPEGYSLGGRVKIGSSFAWLITPPTTQEATNLLVAGALGLGADDVTRGSYHGIFLSHTGEDKSFVRDLKARLEAHGVKNVWLDEAEIQIGDSLTKKIEDGLRKTKYIGIVLSPRSIKSPWVEKELEVAITREISTGEVVVLPLLYEECELPAFLVGKMYADFTSPAKYDESLGKLLRRLKTL
ncbi:MAG: molecular chaperone Tir [Nitrospira sp. ST-bin5]|nr:MAG: molecular chaperone Tir [Nitrospira sp. ST-bin5]